MRKRCNVGAAASLLLAALALPAAADGYLWLGHEDDQILRRFNIDTGAFDLIVDTTVPLSKIPPSNLACDVLREIRETGAAKYAVLQLTYMSGVAWVAAFIVFHSLRALGVS